MNCTLKIGTFHSIQTTLIQKILLVKKYIVVLEDKRNILIENNNKTRYSEKARIL